MVTPLIFIAELIHVPQLWPRRNGWDINVFRSQQQLQPYL